jgi:hypothetical protein
MWDPSQTPGTPVLHAVASTTTGSVSASVRIFDITANAAISGSTLTTSSTSEVELTSSALTMGGTRRLYEFQVKSGSFGTDVICGSAWLE